MIRMSKIKDLYWLEAENHFCMLVKDSIVTNEPENILDVIRTWEKENEVVLRQYKKNIYWIPRPFFNILSQNYKLNDVEIRLFLKKMIKKHYNVD